MNLVDTHCHLQFEKLASKVEEVLKNARANSVTKMICVGTSVSDSRPAVDYAQRFDDVWAAVGSHPHDGKDFVADRDVPQFVKLLGAPKVVAVGEIGLDFYKNYSPKSDQEAMLRSLIEASIASDLPYIFHVRDAFTDFWRIYDSYPKLRGVIHSFSATPAELEQALSRGLYVALNGIMTFTKDADQLAAAKQVPKDRLLLETDAPFLAPAPERGRLCEPKHVLQVAEFLAQLRNEPVEEIADYTTANAEKLFAIR